MADRETELREQLVALRRRYHDEGAPIIEEITKIEAMKPRAPMIYADLLSGLMGEGMLSRIMREQRWLIEDAKREIDAVAKISALEFNGDAITRTWTDEEGNLVAQPVPPTEFYAQPERKCFVCGAVGDADHLGFCSESW